MAKSPPEGHRKEQIERLTALVEYFVKTLPTNATALARHHLDISPSTLSNAKARGVSADVRARFGDRLGVQRRYWLSEKRLSPEECVVPTGARAEAIQSRTAECREEILKVAEYKREPHEVLARLAVLKPPPGSESRPWWWIWQYVLISEEFHKKKTA